MHQNDYLNEKKLKAVWAVEENQSHKLRKEQMIESLPKFIQKGQSKKLSAWRSKQLAKFLTNQCRLSETSALGVMRHKKEWQECCNQTMTEQEKGEAYELRGVDWQLTIKVIPKLQEQWLMNIEMCSRSNQKDCHQNVM